MITSERRDGPTPAGGAYSVMYYLDMQHNAVDKEAATVLRICEYDEQGKLLFETLGFSSQNSNKHPPEA
jgi:hypothetical protein